MDYIFYNCNNLISLDISYLNTSSVLRMYDLFYNCSNLISVDLTNFDTSSAKNMANMFKLCNSNLIYCIKNINAKNEKIITQIETDIAHGINNCSDICF